MDTATPAAIVIGVSLEPPYMRSGSTGTYPNVGLSATFTYPPEQLPRPPVPNWAGCPQAYLEARQEEPLLAFLIDPLVRGTGRGSSNDWPATPTVQPQTAPWLPAPQFGPKFPPGHRSLDFMVDFPFPRPGSLWVDPAFHLTFTSDYPVGRHLFFSPATPSPAAPGLPESPLPAPAGLGALYSFLEGWQRWTAFLTAPVAPHEVAPPSPSSPSFPDAPFSRRLGSQGSFSVDASLGPTFPWAGSRPPSGIGLSLFVEYNPLAPAVQPQAAPGLPDHPSESSLPPSAEPQAAHELPDRPSRQPFWANHSDWLYSDGPFPGEPGYAEWKANHPEEAALYSDPRVVSRSDDLERYIRRVAADLWSRPPRPFGEETLPPIRRRYSTHPHPLTGEELRFSRFTEWAAAVRRSPTRRYSLYTTRQLVRGRISSQPPEPFVDPIKERPFPGEPGYPEWKAAHPKEAASLSTQRLPRLPRRRYSPFWGRSRLELDGRRMKVRFVHEAFGNRRPIKQGTELERASRTAKALLRRRHRPSPGAFEETPAKQVEYFLPVIGTLLLTVPPTVLYFVNDYKTVLPFAANYDSEGLRYTYDHLKGRLKLPNQLYFMFVGSSALDKVTGECEQARDWAGEWYKRTYLPLFIPKNTRARYSREKDAAEAAERERLLILRAKRIHLTRGHSRLPAFLYAALQQKFTPTPPREVVGAYISGEVPEVPATLPGYFTLLQWGLPYGHGLQSPSAAYVAAHGLFPDYDYEYPADDLVLYVDEKGRKIVEISEEALADADDPKDTEQLEEEARRDAEEKERLFGPL